MGKIKKKHYMIVAVLFVLLVICPSFTVEADVAADLRVEQIVSKMPDLKAYLAGTDVAALDLNKIEASLDGEALEVKNLQRFVESGEGIRYFLLLDISSSISESDFQGLKEAVLDFAERLREKDEAYLLTFGDSVNILWTHEEGSACLKERLDFLVNDNQNTQLYEALIQASDLCAQYGDMMRKSAVVLTDGLDDIKGKSTKEEAMSKILKNGLPVYGIAIGDGDKEGIDRFGELIRGSSGRLYLTQKENVVKTLRKLDKNVKNAWILSMKGNTNLVAKGEQEITLQFSQYNLTKNIQSGFYQWYPDNLAPWIKEARQTEKNQLRIIFSESVEGIDNAGNFQLKNAEGKSFVPKWASPTGDTEVELTFEDDFYQGEYSLECSNIHDISMEKNEVREPCSLTLEGEKESKIKDFLRAWGWLMALIGVILAAALLLFIYLRIRKHKGIVLVDDKFTLASNLQKDVRQVVELEEKEGIHLRLYISTGKSQAIELERDLYDSAIVGRSDICEVCVKDTKMSKQHFALEYQEGYVYLSDLESTNGTMLNGIAVTGRHRLAKGDKITAGNTTVCVKWEDT
ncbi:MAG: FHA domain-containing protein [Eubacteriales bacterium]|nr:FHA domain-containing protein [Eubacteriales bacterium]